MEHHNRISDLESRIRALNLSFGALCDKAGVRRNNASRWRNHQGATLRVYQRDMGLLEAALAAEELRLLDYLKVRHAEAPEPTANANTTGNCSKSLS